MLNKKNTKLPEKPSQCVSLLAENGNSVYSIYCTSLVMHKSNLGSVDQMTFQYCNNWAEARVLGKNIPKNIRLNQLNDTLFPFCIGRLLSAIESFELGLYLDMLTNLEECVSSCVFEENLQAALAIYYDAFYSFDSEFQRTTNIVLPTELVVCIKGMLRAYNQTEYWDDYKHQIKTVFDLFQDHGFTDILELDLTGDYESWDYCNQMLARFSALLP